MNFPGIMALLGAWLCAFGFVVTGMICFILGSAYNIAKYRDIGFNFMFALAAVVSLVRLL